MTDPAVDALLGQVARVGLLELRRIVIGEAVEADHVVAGRRESFGQV